MPDTGWKAPSATGTHNGSGGTGAWYANERVKAEDGVASYIGPVGATMANNQVTQWLWCQDFAFSIPAAAIVTGVSIRIRMRRTSGAIVLRDVLLRQDAPFGIFLEQTNKLPNKTIGGAWEVLEYGGQNDAWGWTGLTRANVVKAGFGCAIACRAAAAGSNVEVDSVQLKIHYNATTTVTPDPIDSVIEPVAATALASSVTLSPAPVESAAEPVPTTALRSSVTLSGLGVPESETLPDEATDVGPSNYFKITPAESPETATEVIAIDPADVIKSSAAPIIAAVESVSEPHGATIVRGSVSLTPSEYADSEALPVDAIARLAVVLYDLPIPESVTDVTLDDVQITWNVVALFDDFDRNSQQTAIRAFPLLVTITHPDLPTTLRYTNAGEEIQSRGHIYDDLPMTITLPSAGRGAAAEALITVPTQARQVRGTFRTLSASERTKVLIEMVRGDDPNIVEKSWRLRVAGTETSQAVVIALDDGDFEARQFPPVVFNAQWRAVHD